MQNLITALSNSLIVYFYIFITFFLDIFENWLNNDYMVFNTDKIKFIAHDILDISWYLFGFYICVYLLNISICKYYKKFINLNSNLIQTKSKYFLFIQLFMTFYKMHDTNIAILIFIAFVQYKMLGKLINLINYGLLNLIALAQSAIQWHGDKQTHVLNLKKVQIRRNGLDMIISNCEIKINDIIHLNKGNEIPIKSGKPLSKAVVFNFAQTGEKNKEEFKANQDYVLEGLVVLNEMGLDILVTETFANSNINIKQDNINTVQNLFYKSTNVGICTIGLFAIIIYFHEHSLVNPIDIVDFLVCLTGCFIGLNYLIPSFKIQQSMNLWDSAYKYVCNKLNFKVCTHGDITKLFESYNTVILSDKTGTLTKGIFTVEKYFINEKYINLCVGHINGMKFNDEHISHSPETNVMLDFLYSKYKVQIGSQHYWTNIIQNIHYKLDEEIFEFTRYANLLYQAENLGSHSVSKVGDQIYHVFMGNKALLSSRLDYTEKVNSTKRGMLIGFIKLNDLAEFAISIGKFRNQNQPIASYEIIAEFHFDDVFRVCNSQTTYLGLNKLKDSDYPFYMITGDSCLTAKAIGQDLNINSEVIDGAEFVSKILDEQNVIISNLLDKKSGIFANTRAIYKEQIVKLFKAQNKNIVFLGDQENDFFALQAADLAIVQAGGNSKCKNIANLVGEVPTEIAYEYLLTYRNLGIYGKAWFYKELIRFNYLTAIIWLIGIIKLNFTRTNLLFIDPWGALYSLVMSTTITLLCMYRSIKHTNQKIQDYQIVYVEPVKAIMLGFVCGLILYLLPFSYNKYSLVVITLLMVVG
jgi:magnesium-transporting ATPase (P-type)